jgi:fumarate reductase flavoprotein subunit
MKNAYRQVILAIVAVILPLGIFSTTGWAQAPATVIDADVVVIGGGTAGMSAAVTALQKGAHKVVVVEKQPYIGGNSALAGGMLYSPTRTSLPSMFAATMPESAQSQGGGQSAAPVKTDDELRDAAIKETLEFHHYEHVNARLIGVLIDKARETTKWFNDLGINADANAGAPGSFGKTLTMVAAKYAAMGGETMVNTTVKKILKDSTGKVSGVLATTKEGKAIQINAPAVVLATGGFTGNLALLKKYFPYYSPDTISSEASHTNMGEGIQLASDAGGALADYATLIKENGFSFKTGSALNNRMSMNASIWVNKHGQRFIDETVGHSDESTNALIDQPGMLGFALYDDDQITAMDNAGPGQPATAGKSAMTTKEKLQAEAKQDSKWVKISDDWDGIAAWLGANPKTLKATIEEYNGYCEKGRDELFGKDKKSLVPLRKGPYYAVRFGPLMIDTIGPVIINEHMEVQNKQGESIPGFYAAGVITSGWQGRDYHLFGSALGLSSTGGRIAGENAANYAAANKK